MEPSEVSSRESPEVRRSHILGEAIRLVGQRGSGGLRVQELARRCGLSNAGVLYYFGSKEELLLQMIQELGRREAAVIEPLVRTAERELEQGAPSKRALLALLHTMASRACQSPELGLPLLVLQAEALEPRHPAHRFFRNRDRMAADLFTRLVAPHVKYPVSTAWQLLALMTGLLQQWVGSGRGFDIVAEWDRAVVAVLGGPAGCAGEAAPGREQITRGAARAE